MGWRFWNYQLVLDGMPNDSRADAIFDALDRIESNPIAPSGVFVYQARVNGSDPLDNDPAYIAELPHGCFLKYELGIGSPGMGATPIMVLAFGHRPHL